MDSALLRFVSALRHEGVRVSTAEALDAVRAVRAAGIESRGVFRAALRASLAKSRRSQHAFDAIFDRFFTGPVLPSRRKGARQEPGGEPGRDGRGTDGAGRRPPTRPGPQPEEGRKARGAPAGERRGRRGPPGDERRKVSGILRRGDGRQGALEDARAPGPARKARHLSLVLPLATAEEEAIAREVPRMLAELRARPGRRPREERRGDVWVARLFRKNLPAFVFDGPPFVLPRRRPRRKRLRLVVLVDVSHSVARAAGLFLLLASGIASRFAATRVFLFVDRPVEATRAVLAWTRGGGSGGRVRGTPRKGPARGRGPIPVSARGRPGEGIRGRKGAPSFADFLRSRRDLDPGAPSDYGRVFWSLARDQAQAFSRDAVLVVLGDGRTNVFDPLPWAFEALARRVRRVLWIVPEPAARWGTGDSALPAYLEWTDAAVESDDLAGLLEAIRLLRAEAA